MADGQRIGMEKRKDIAGEDVTQVEVPRRGTEVCCKGCCSHSTCQTLLGLHLNELKVYF